MPVGGTFPLPIAQRSSDCVAQIIILLPCSIVFWSMSYSRCIEFISPFSSNSARSRSLHYFFFKLFLQQGFIHASIKHILMNKSFRISRVPVFRRPSPGSVQDMPYIIFDIITILCLFLLNFLWRSQYIIFRRYLAILTLRWSVLALYIV